MVPRVAKDRGPTKAKAYVDLGILQPIISDYVRVVRDGTCCWLCKESQAPGSQMVAAAAFSSGKFHSVVDLCVACEADLQRAWKNKQEAKP